MLSRLPLPQKLLWMLSSEAISAAARSLTFQDQEQKKKWNKSFSVIQSNFYFFYLDKISLFRIHFCKSKTFSFSLSPPFFFFFNIYTNFSSGFHFFDFLLVAGNNENLKVA